ncbi:MAG: phosphoenolpyruvate synthase [Oligoflexus sp.]
MKHWIIDQSSPANIAQTKSGGKALNLYHMSRQNLPVPPWFCIAQDAFIATIQENQIDKIVQLTPEKIHTQGISAISKQIENQFLEADLPQELEQALNDALKERDWHDSFLAVRSSGLDEDSAEHSFAGQFSSFLFQKGLAAVIRSLKLCWASAFSERALAYRLERGLNLDKISMGVIIQKMVHADAAGVAFSRHPIRVMERDTVLISSVWGLGEGLVSGALDADTFEFDRHTQALKSDLVTKQEAMALDPRGGIQTVSVEAEKQQLASLTDSQVKEIANLCIQLEAQFQKPQDIEWAYENKEVFLLQTRPITNLPPDTFFDKKIRGEEPILWDNSNIIESYSGVTSPLTFSFASRAYYQVYVQFCEVMGVPEAIIRERDPMFRNMLGLIRGRIYYNLINWYRLVLMLPGSKTNKTFMETMMGVRQQIRPELQGIFEIVQEAPHYSLTAKIRLTFKTIARFLQIDQIVNEFTRHFNTIYDDARKKKFEEWSLNEQVHFYHHLEEKVLKRWHAPIINDYLCMIFFGLLKKFTGQWLEVSAAESLQNDLLCGEGGLESTEPTKFLMRIAEFIDQGNSEFRDWFIQTETSSVWKALKHDKKSPEIYKKFEEFLDRYGFRCINELKLEAQDLHDDPSFIVMSVAGYVRTKSYRIDEMEKREREIRSHAESEVRKHLSGPRLMIFFWILKQARKAVKNRENLRFARTKIFGVSRHLMRAIGKNLYRLGHLTDPQDVFYMTVEEIIAFHEGRSVTLSIQELVALRKKEFLHYEAGSYPPDRFLTLGAAGASFPYANVLLEADLLRHTGDNDDPSLLIGTPCSPGIIEGVVRVVRDFKDAEGLNGEILVTERTDPGWVPLYPSCSGLIIERGSLLSHSAVVARELGLPTIVGVTGGLMTRLQTGQRVRIDAGKGEVRILD